MFDQGPDIPGAEPEDDTAYLLEFFGKRLPIKVDDLRGLDPEEQVRFVMREAQSINWLSKDISLDQFKLFIHVLKTHEQAWRNYELRTYSGSITLFRTANQPAIVSQERDLGWGRLVEGGVEVVDVPGDHNSMLHEENVVALAADLKRRMTA